MQRKHFLKILALGSAAAGFPSALPGPSQKSDSLITKTIPSSGIELPAIGMGTWITFDVGRDRELRNHRTRILREFFNRGGGIIDSSPMYGSSESVVGYGLDKLNHPDPLFSATKVWTSSTSEGRRQIEQSMDRWKVSHLDLEQVHNLVNWRDHLDTLFKRREEGTVKHVGVTTYGGYRHRELEKIMKSQPIDFIQLTYNVENRRAEKRILPLAREEEIAVIANRPFGGGPLIARMQQHPYPSWGADLGCQNWPQLLLQFIVSHPALTCAIPATTQIQHMKENMGAAHGTLLTEDSRQRILTYISEL